MRVLDPWWRSPTRRRSLVVVLPLVLALCASSSVAAHEVDAPTLPEWTDVFGSPSAYDNGLGIASDSEGNVVATGWTNGAFPGQEPGGSGLTSDGWVRKWDSDGNVAWTVQFGGEFNDHSWAVAVDADDHIFLGGEVNEWPWPDPVTFRDAFLRQYDTDGSLLWQEEFGTAGQDAVSSIVFDTSGNMYVGGYTTGQFPGEVQVGWKEGFLRKYDDTLTEVWTHQFGGPGDTVVTDMAIAPNGDVVLSADTRHFPGETAYGRRDALVLRFAPDGNLIWADQFGTAAYDSAIGVAVSADDSIFVCGYAEAALPGTTHFGGYDAYVRRYSGDGTVVWTDQFGTASVEYAYDLAVNSLGELFVVGTYRYSSGFLAVYTDSGEHLWTTELGGLRARGVVADSLGNAFVVGTWANTDAYVRKYGTTPVLPRHVRLLYSLFAAVHAQVENNGVATALDGHLDAALALLTDDDPTNDLVAVNRLNAFISLVEAQDGKQIAAEDAAFMITQAQQIIDLFTE